MFVKNNEEIDYAKIASVSAKCAIRALNVPVSIVTDYNTVQSIEDKSVFDKIIVIDDNTNQIKRYYDTISTFKVLKFKNLSRMLCYDLSPYDQTLVMDIDLFLLNDKLKYVWESNDDFLINSYHVNLIEDLEEFNKISDIGIDFYWATVFYFKKTDYTKKLFDLSKHIIDNYEYYSLIYNLPYGYIRNDYVISVAIHIMHGFDNYTKPGILPCDIYYTLDKDVLYKIHPNKNMTFLIQEKDRLDEYLLASIKEQNVHIMNKYDLMKNIDRLDEILNG